MLDTDHGRLTRGRSLAAIRWAANLGQGHAEAGVTDWLERSVASRGSLSNLHRFHLRRTLSARTESGQVGGSWRARLELGARRRCEVGWLCRIEARLPREPGAAQPIPTQASRGEAVAAGRSGSPPVGSRRGRRMELGGPRRSGVANNRRTSPRSVRAGGCRWLLAGARSEVCAGHPNKRLKLTARLAGQRAEGAAAVRPQPHRPSRRPRRGRSVVVSRAGGSLAAIRWAANLGQGHAEVGVTDWLQRSVAFRGSRSILHPRPLRRTLLARTESGQVGGTWRARLELGPRRRCGVGWR